MVIPGVEAGAVPAAEDVETPAELPGDDAGGCTPEVTPEELERAVVTPEELETAVCCNRVSPGWIGMETDL